jgi:hypothetical protein
MIEPRCCLAALALAALALAGCGSSGPAPAASASPTSATPTATPTATGADMVAACKLASKVARYAISSRTTPAGYEALESLMREQRWPPALADKARAVEADLLGVAAGSRGSSDDLISDIAALAVAACG